MSYTRTLYEYTVFYFNNYVYFYVIKNNCTKSIILIFSKTFEMPSDKELRVVLLRFN